MKSRKISFSSVLDVPLILFPSMHQCRKLLDKTSHEIGKQLEPIVETSSIKSILNLVRNGVGRSVVSRTLYEFYDTEDLFFQHIENPSLNRTVFLVMKKNCFINYAARKYIKLLVREIEKLRFQTEKDAILLYIVLYYRFFLSLYADDCMDKNKEVPQNNGQLPYFFIFFSDHSFCYIQF